MILAGDFGGTKSVLALFERQKGKLQLFRMQKFPSKSFDSPEDVIRNFLEDNARSIKASVACFSVAGPVFENSVHFTNLNWKFGGESVARMFGIARVILVNDLVATAHSLEMLGPSDLLTLQHGNPVDDANRAVIAVGTGMGELISFWDGVHHVPIATESGHTDFAPRTEAEINLLRYFKKKYSHVSWEVVLSTRGIREIHEFLGPSQEHDFNLSETDPAPMIAENVRKGLCSTCIEVLSLWAAMYGAEAGNLALRSLAKGGLYLGGGVSSKLSFKLQEGEFLQAFRQKGRHWRRLLSQIPIHVLLNEEAPLLGAACVANQEEQVRLSRAPNH